MLRLFDRCLIAGIAFAISATLFAADPIKIGFVNEITGPQAEAGQYTLNGAKMALEEIKAGWDNPIDMEQIHFATNFASRLGPLLDEWEDRMDPGLVGW